MIWLPWRDRKQFCSVDEIEVKRKEIAYPENVPRPFYVVCTTIHEILLLLRRFSVVPNGTPVLYFLSTQH
jgi:hypothetical protein